MRTKNIILALGLVTCVVLTGCSKKKVNDEIVIPANELYASGVKLLQDKKYSKAADEFEKIFFQHPGNPMTPQAELMQAYSLYLAADYDIAYDVLDVFIKLHPRHEDIEYAYYLKGMANYAQISSVKLDQSRTKLAKADFEALINRFPGSKYSIDAALKLDLINDHLAGKEMLVGRYYLKKRNPIAAIQRFQTVINSYSTTMHTQEALYRMVESNVMLGLFDEAEKYASVLGHNFPDSNWYKKAYSLLK